MKIEEQKPKYLWERQDNESTQAFEAFVIYRDMGNERSLSKVCQKLGKTNTLISRWSKKYKWVSRVEAWIDEQDRLTRESLIKGVTSMRKNHTNIATKMLVKALSALNKFPIDNMTSKDIVNMIDIATKLERISRGEVTEKTENKTEFTGKFKINTANFSILSDNELETLNELTDKITIS